MSEHEQWEKVPLAQRLQRLNAGLPSSPDSGAALVRRWAEMPLEDYLAGQPKAIRFFQEALGPKSLSRPYQEAAVKISVMLEKNKEKGQDALWYLSFPLQVAYMRRKK